jgi:peptidoglycan/LPS O-acetylase OafA/YrhL
LPTQTSFSGFCCCADSARSAALVAIAAASYHIYLLHRILPEALFDRANPATFTAPLPVAVSVVPISSSVASCLVSDYGQD